MYSISRTKVHFPVLPISSIFPFPHSPIPSSHFSIFPSLPCTLFHAQKSISPSFYRNRGSRGGVQRELSISVLLACTTCETCETCGTSTMNFAFPPALIRPSTEWSTQHALISYVCTRVHMYSVVILAWAVAWLHVTFITCLTPNPLTNRQSRERDLGSLTRHGYISTTVSSWRNELFLLQPVSKCSPSWNLAHR